MNADENQIAGSSSDMEPNPANAPYAAQDIARLAAQCGVCIHIHSRRKRLCDADGISGKAVIDGLVHAGILPNDSPEFVKAVSYSQEKADTEETIIEIYQQRLKELEGE